MLRFESSLASFIMGHAGRLLLADCFLQVAFSEFCGRNGENTVQWKGRGAGASFVTLFSLRRSGPGSGHLDREASL